MANKNSTKSNKNKEDQKWFDRDDISDLAKFGSEFLKKTVSSGIDAIKEVKENIPKEASHMLHKGKEELLRTLTPEAAHIFIDYTIEKFFAVARNHRLEFSIRLRKQDETKSHNKE